MDPALPSLIQDHLAYRQDCESRFRFALRAEAALLTPSPRAGCAPHRGDTRRFRAQHSVHVGKVTGGRANSYVKKKA